MVKFYNFIMKVDDNKPLKYHTNNHLYQIGLEIGFLVALMKEKEKTKFQ